MKLTRSTTPKPFKAAKPVAPAKPAQPAQPDDVDFQDVVRMLTDVTQQNKDFAEGLSILTQKVDQIVKSIAEVMKTNKEFCESVIQEISAISEYINIPAEDGEAEEAEEDKSEETEEAEAAEEEGITADDIMGMKKSEIIALIEDNDLPINPADYPKVADLRKALIQYLEEEFDADNGPTEDSADEDDGDEGEVEGPDDDIEADGDDIEGDEETGGNADDDDDDW